MPLREEAREGAEMVSQMLLGETAAILEIQERWIRIRTTFDDYEGWVNPGQCGHISAGQLADWLNHPDLTRSPWRNHTVFSETEGDALVVPYGALVAKRAEGIALPDGEYVRADVPLLHITGNDIVETAERLAGTPYLWGGRSDMGIDCSGLVQLLFAQFGYAMPRDSGMQFKLAEPYITSLTEISSAQRGDLVFFANPAGRIVHVGIYVADGCLVHAGPNVRINCFAPKWKDRVLFPYDDNLTAKFRGIIRPEDLRLRHAWNNAVSYPLIENRYPQLIT